MADREHNKRRLRINNGQELISSKLDYAAEKNGVLLDFIEPGKLAQNAYVERFNRTYREKVLALYLFDTLAEVRAITEAWVEEHNVIRPHDVLGSLMSYKYAAKVARSKKFYS